MVTKQSRVFLEQRRYMFCPGMCSGNMIVVLLETMDLKTEEERMLQVS